MCFAQPVSQPQMGKPAGYAVNEAYGQVRKATVGPDGTRTELPPSKTAAAPAPKASTSGPMTMR